MTMLVDRNMRDAMQVADIDGDGFAVEKGREIQLHQQHSINRNLEIAKKKDLHVGYHE